MTSNSPLTLKWINYKKHGDLVRNLRREVFVEEQALEDFMMDSPFDDNGLHLGLFDQVKLVSVISLFLHPNNSTFVEELGLQSRRPYLVQYSRRAELPEYRSKKLASLMVAHAIKSVYDLFQSDIMFATLLGVHMQLKDMYVNMYGFNRTFETEDKNGPLLVLVMDDINIMKQLVLLMRTESLRLSRQHHIELPDLAYHIESNPNLFKFYKMEADSTNRYLQPLSLEDELPRLSAQARMLFMTQEPIWKELIARYSSLNQILDLGCGPGVYISNISKIKEANTLNIIGMDISEQFITYAQFAHPKLSWQQGSAYDTGYADKSFDLVHTSFLFIHLTKPYLAIKEIQRILKEDGLFYISDVNDATFKGPEVIAKMVKKHSEIYEGNREIMMDMDYLATRVGMEIIKSHTIIVENTGTDSHPTLEGNTLKLGKWTMWAMFSFMGQRSEISDDFDQAESHYLKYNDTISIEIQTKIYKK
jgi:SAM-dependent methyltransferase/predicted GNAT family N-acyltransferase